MTRTSQQSSREGLICLHDASLKIWEESIPSPSAAGGFKARDAWEAAFKREVFDLIIDTLSSIGWTVGAWADAHLYPAIAKDYRTCQKGGLHAQLSVGGRCVDLEFWQDVTPSKNPNGGKFDFNKFARMPYVLRLELQRARRRVCRALCGAFAGYSVAPRRISSPNPDPLAYFNDGWDSEYDKKNGTHRFKRGADGWPSDEELLPSYRTDKDGRRLNHGDIRWARDDKGRLRRGAVFGGINGQWTMVFGPGASEFTHVHGNQLFAYRPGETPRKLADPCERRKQLERQLQAAIKVMNFKRAELLKNILFPTDPLFAIYHKGHGVYIGVMYCGYCKSLKDAGRYTRAELKPYFRDKLETPQLKAVPLSAELEAA